MNSTNFCREVKSWRTWDSTRRNTSHKILEYLVLVRANILVEKYVLVTNLCSLHWKGAKEAGGRRERNGQGGACGLELGVRWVWAWAWRTVTASWADARVTVAWEERAAWEMGKGEREKERGCGGGARGRDLDSIYGFHRCCVCRSLTAAIMSKDCFTNSTYTDDVINPSKLFHYSSRVFRLDL